MILELAIVYLVICAAACVFQRRLIYYPTKLTTEAANDEAVARGFSAWRNPSGTIIGWQMRASPETRGSVLVVHGNAGCALDRDYLAEPIRDGSHLNVFVLEFPGYGVRTGSPSMKSLLAAGTEAFDLLKTNGPVFVVSESIGAGTAAYLAKTNPGQLAGLVMFAPFDNLVSVANNQMPFLFPGLFLWDRYDPEGWLSQYRGPVKVILAGSDEVIPPKFGRRLFDSLQGPKELQQVPRAGHNDVAEQSPEWWKETVALLRQPKDGAVRSQ